MSFPTDPTMSFSLPPLPYPKDALQPHMSQETLEFHHGKHHAAYFKKLNDLVKGSPFESMSLVEIVKKSDGAVYNNAAQAWNHTFFWQSMSPGGGGAPHGPIADAINASFGSFDAFKEKFSEIAGGHFGSGWAWLVQKSDGSLAVVGGHDAHNPMSGACLRWLPTCSWPSP